MKGMGRCIRGKKMEERGAGIMEKGGSMRSDVRGEDEELKPLRKRQRKQRMKCRKIQGCEANK